jgi:hypothetical protein
MDNNTITEKINVADKKELTKDAINKAKEVLSDAKNQKNYNTGTIFENVFASMWKKMPTEQLESHRKLLNKIIAERKITSRIISAKTEIIKKDK